MERHIDRDMNLEDATHHYNNRFNDAAFMNVVTVATARIMVEHSANRELLDYFKGLLIDGAIVFCACECGHEQSDLPEYYWGKLDALYSMAAILHSVEPLSVFLRKFNV
ncbi:MAG: hypothetical protein AAFV33_09485 [Chloroflexota bacterium]